VMHVAALSPPCPVTGKSGDLSRRAAFSSTWTIFSLDEGESKVSSRGRSELPPSANSGAFTMPVTEALNRTRMYGTSYGNLGTGDGRIKAGRVRLLTGHTGPSCILQPGLTLFAKN
jgi:hypothetical protein